MDPYTVGVEHIILLAVFCLLTLANTRINKGTRGMRWFSCYMLCFFIAILLLRPLPGHRPGSTSLTEGGLLTIASHFLLYLSVSEVLGQTRSQIWLQWLLMVVGTIATLQFVLIHPNTDHRVISLSVVVGIQSAQIALLLYRRSDLVVRAAGAPLAWILTGSFLSNLVRASGLLLHGVYGHYFSTSSFRTWLEIVNTGLQCGTVVAYIWMTASLLRRDLELQAATDPLTGLLNRRAIDRLAQSTLTAATTGLAKTSVITMDIDGFKEINDTLGHDGGDQALVHVAQCLREQLRPNDLIARLGGDEFAVLLPNTSIAMASEIAERLRVAIEGLEILWGQSSVHVTASIGFSQSTDSDSSWDHLVTKCDHALYAAKRAGGNRVSESDPESYQASGNGRSANARIAKDKFSGSPSEAI